jgi:hypothetical protein
MFSVARVCKALPVRGASHTRAQYTAGASVIDDGACVCWLCCDKMFLLLGMHERVRGGGMDAVARNSHASIFQVASKGCDREILFGDAGPPPPSSTMYLLKLERQQLIQRAAEKRFFLFLLDFGSEEHSIGRCSRLGMH